MWTRRILTYLAGFWDNRCSKTAHMERAIKKAKLYIDVILG
jgi:hypothetical protein